MESGEGNKPQDAEDIKDAYKPNVLGKEDVPPPMRDPHADIVRRAVSGDFDEEAERRRLRDVGGLDRFKQIADSSGNLPSTGSAEWSFGYSLNPQENSSRHNSSEANKSRRGIDALKRLLGIADKEIKKTESREPIDDSSDRSQVSLEEFQTGMIGHMKNISDSASETSKIQGSSDSDSTE